MNQNSETASVFSSSNQQSEEILKEMIKGARNFRSFIVMIILFLAGIGFFLAGLSSYFHKNFLQITDTSELVFLPQGVAMLFYGTGALGLAFYNLITIILDIGSGYNEFSKKDQIARLVRRGFPGKNRILFLSYEFASIKSVKLLIKQGLNPRCNLLLVLKDKREIPLFPAQILLNPTEIEKKAVELSSFLNVPLENTKI